MITPIKGNWEYFIKIKDCLMIQDKLCKNKSCRLNSFGKLDVKVKNQWNEIIKLRIDLA